MLDEGGAGLARGTDGWDLTRWWFVVAPWGVSWRRLAAPFWWLGGWVILVAVMASHGGLGGIVLTYLQANNEEACIACPLVSYRLLLAFVAGPKLRQRGGLVPGLP